jgi:hypothetical protein
MTTTLDQFPLEAEVTLTELRSEEKLTKRLRAHHRLRVRRRNDLVGVLLDIDEWHQLVHYVAKLEAEAQLREDETARAIIATRAPRAVFAEGSPEAVDEIEREYQGLVADRAQSSDARS